MRECWLVRATQVKFTNSPMTVLMTIPSMKRERASDTVAEAKLRLPAVGLGLLQSLPRSRL